MSRRASGWAAAALVVAACTGAGSTEWAREAVVFVEAWDEAAAASTTEGMRRFRAPDVVVEDCCSRGPWCAGVDQCTDEFVREFGPRIDQPVAGALHLDLDGLARMSTTTIRGNDHSLLTAADVGSAGLVTHEAHLETLWAVADRVGDDRVGPMVELAERWRAALLSGDASAIASLYVADATLTDSLFGVELEGAASIAEASLAMGTWRAVVPASGEPAVYASLELDETSAPVRSGQLAMASTVDAGQGCPGDIITALDIDDGHIVAARVFHGVWSIRECVDETDGLPDGWWTGIDPPAPPTDEVSGVVETAGGDVEIHNGSRGLERLVTWSLQRFVEAGLVPPAVRSISFDPAAHVDQCADEVHGRAAEGSDGFDLYICVEERLLRVDESSEFTSNGRQLMLHELAHAWSTENLDAADHERHLAARGLAAWRGDDVPWAERGTEHVAAVVAWGLMDGPSADEPLEDDSCAELTSFFRSVTGAVPLFSCGPAR